jgi:hypothetical protein
MDASAQTSFELKRDLAREILRSSGELRLRATGISMLPALWPDDMLCIRSLPTEEYLPGDIVLFARNGMLVAHRLVERTEGTEGIQWLTRGDMADCNDAPLSSHELLGRVTTIERGGRWVEPRRSSCGYAAAWVLRHSRFATRLVLWLGRWGRQLGTWGWRIAIRD